MTVEESQPQLEDSAGDEPERGRRWPWAVLVLAIGLVIAAALAWAGDDDDVTSSGTTTSSSSSSTTSTTTSSTTSTSTSTTTSVSTPTAPVAVGVVSARPGGGSGEVVLEWDTVPDATGYKVLRSASSAGGFAVTATVDVTSGVATAGDEVVNIWSDAHSYIPSDGPLGSPDTSPHLNYVDVGAPGQRCYQVVAYNDGGDASPSVVTCSSPEA